MPTRYWFAHACLLLSLAFGAVADRGHLDTSAVPGNWRAMGGALKDGCNGPVMQMHTLPDGRILLSGTFSACGNAAVDNIAFYSPTTGLFESVGEGLPHPVRSIALGDHGFYASATRTNGAGYTESMVAYWNGSQWQRLSDQYVAPGTLVVHQGALLMGGQRLEGPQQPNVLLRLWDGQAWVRMATADNSTDSVHELAVFGDQLYVSGRFTQMAGVAANSIARYHQQQWHALGEPPAQGVRFDNGDEGHIYEMSASTNKLCMTGQFQRAGNISASDVACWNGTEFSAVGAGINGGEGITDSLTTPQGFYAAGLFMQPNGVSLGPTRLLGWDGSGWSNMLYRGSTDLYSLALGSDGLYAGGSISQVVDLPVNNLARLGPAGWEGVGNFENAQGLPWVTATARFQGQLYVAGNFRAAGFPHLTGLARWDGNTWQPVGGAAGQGVAGVVYDLHATENLLYVGGDFTAAGGIAATDVATWDGQTWNSVGTPPNGSVYALQLYEGMLYAGGSICFVSSNSYCNVVRWDGNAWTYVGSGFGIVSLTNIYLPAVNAFAVHDGQLYAGGRFNNVGGGSVANLWNLARWDGAQWRPVGGEFRGGVNGVVRGLVSAPDGLYVGGEFNAAGPIGSNGVPTGTNAGRIARWDGKQWHAVGGGVADDDGPYVDSLAVSGQRVIAGGDFSRIGSIHASNIAAWDGTRWQRLGNGVNGRVLDITPDGDNGFHAGGVFGRAGTEVSVGIAHWEGDVGAIFADGFEFK